MSENISGPTIERCPHDRDHPYTMILNSLIRDNSISPNCRLVLIHLLSNRDEWKIRITCLWNQFKDHIGRDKFQNIINEAIEAGYIKREIYKEGNLNRFRYLLSEIPKFKKYFPHPDVQGPENPATNKDEVFMDINSEENPKEKTTSVFVPLEISEKQELLKRYELKPNLLREFLGYPLEELKESLRAYEQYICVQELNNERVINPIGSLINAIRQRWKYNEKVIKKSILKDWKARNLDNTWGAGKICEIYDNEIIFTNGESLSLEIDPQEFNKKFTEIYRSYQ